MTEITSHAEARLHAPIRHLAQAGGKRMRPALVLIAAHLGEGVNDEVERAAVGVELTHLATLYHDDVMDSAQMRRGAPAAHEVWGNSAAILTGDLLFARASQVIASLGAEAVRIHAQTFERLCIGQLNETLGCEAGSDEVAHYIQVLADKTGSLIATSAHYGAMFGGAPAEVIDMLARYGEKVGVAFQLADDVIDLASDADTTGKTPGTDLREGVDTMPILLLRQAAAAGELDESGQAILRQLSIDDLSADDPLANVVAQLRTHPVIDQARALAQSWVDAAVAEIAPLPQTDVKTALTDFAHLIVNRMA
ncbi:MAG: polyprenyl synthetase family protein [Bowdeniella nasicola]|nr:polyprenyl synthetase family protein [Bowdeniella nasicola]